MTREQLCKYLMGVRGTGAWERIAREAGIHYATVARIARGEIGGRVDTHERIQAAIKAVDSASNEPA